MLRQPNQVGSVRMVDAPKPVEHVGLIAIRQQPRSLISTYESDSALRTFAFVRDDRGCRRDGA
jgi:hypothetical protein